MDYLLLGRVAKIAALLGFVLPWVTVSCSGNEILTATGLQLMTGDPQPAGALQGMGGDNAVEDAEPSIAVIVACAAIAIGLGVSFAAKARVAAAALLVGGLGGAGVSYYAMQNMQSEMAREIGEAQNDSPDTGGLLSERDARQMTNAVASAIRVEEEEGYWLTLGGSAAGALMGLIVLAGAGAAPMRPRQAPPP